MSRLSLARTDFNDLVHALDAYMQHHHFVNVERWEEWRALQQRMHDRQRVRKSRRPRPHPSLIANLERELHPPHPSLVNDRGELDAIPF